MIGEGVRYFLLMYLLYIEQ